MVGLSTLAIHADDKYASVDVAPAIHVSTNFHYESDPTKLKTADEITAMTDRLELGEDGSLQEPPLVYSRVNQPNVTRAEAVIGKITGGHVVLYSSGLSAFHAAIMHLNPRQIFIGRGYHGCHGVLSLLHRNYGLKVRSLDDIEKHAQRGDLVHVETPVNPYGTAIDLEYYARLAHASGAIVMCDATFCPPPYLDPMALGADIVLHSASKYFGGHSDVLAGILVVNNAETAQALKNDRVFLGTICTTMESWLLLRSARTFTSRVKQQFATAGAIVTYLDRSIKSLPQLKKIYHASLQNEEFVHKQLPRGGPAVFAIEVKDGETARLLPSKLKYFAHATSLGGVESLIEWRCMSDNTVPNNLLRVSVGLEDTQDLIDDLVSALE